MIKQLLTALLLIFVIVGLATFNPLSFKSATIQTNEILSTTGEYNPSQTIAYFLNQEYSAPLPQPNQMARVLGDESPQKHKWIEVDLTNQRLYAYEDGNKVYDFLVSTGKWGRTPTGTFRIWTKLRYTTMSGGSKQLGTYYYLPNVPFTMFFYNQDIPKMRGYGIHGTYWHNNFGHPMSHGCINMRNEDVEQLYYWANPELSGNKQSISASADNPGTEIYIYGTAPME